VADRELMRVFTDFNYSGFAAQLSLGRETDNVNDIALLPQTESLQTVASLSFTPQGNQTPGPDGKTPVNVFEPAMPETSPTKWHLAHTTWFFETFILIPHAKDYRPFHPDYNFLFNSYYEAVGPRHQRPKRGMLSRPPLADIHAYRRHVEDAVRALIADAAAETWAAAAPLLALGLNHEQQHQELILTDIKHALSLNPMRPAEDQQRTLPSGSAIEMWVLLNHHAWDRLCVTTWQNRNLHRHLNTL